METDRDTRDASLGGTASKAVAGVLTLLAGLWAVMTEPALGLFEQTMRSLGIVGGVLGLLWLLQTVAVTFLAMLVTLFLLSLVLGLVRNARRRHGF